MTDMLALGYASKHVCVCFNMCLSKAVNLPDLQKMLSHYSINLSDPRKGLHCPIQEVCNQTYLKRAFLPNEVPSYPKRVLVDSNDLFGQQDLKGTFAKGSQICSNKQRRLEQ